MLLPCKQKVRRADASNFLKRTHSLFYHRRDFAAVNRSETVGYLKANKLSTKCGEGRHSRQAKVWDYVPWERFEVLHVVEDGVEHNHLSAFLDNLRETLQAT